MNMPEPLPYTAESPEALIREIPLGQSYPIEALGALRGAVEAVHDKTQAPIAIAAQSALSVASLAVQALANVETLAGNAPTSLFCLTIAVSGERKSSCDKLLLAGLRTHEHQAGLDYRINKANYGREMRLRNAKENRMIKDAAGADSKATKANAELKTLSRLSNPPVNPIRTTTDPTFEGLIKLFVESHPSLGLLTDEGGGFIGGHAMNSENRLKTLAGFSSLWDGSPINRTRAGDGAFTLFGRRLTVHMMAQPVVVYPLLSDPMASGQGFLARFLICEPESNIGYRTRVGYDLQSDAILLEFEAKLGEILTKKLFHNAGKENELNPPILSLSSDAKDLLLRYYNSTEKSQLPAGEYALVRPYASKSVEQAARIAGVLALWENPQVKSVSAEQMANGITLAQYYLSEAVRLADTANISETTRQAEMLRKWLLDTWQGEFVLPGDVVQRGPNSLREAVKAKSMLLILEKTGWIVKMPDGTVIEGKARKLSYRVVRPNVEQIHSDPAKPANPANRW